MKKFLLLIPLFYLLISCGTVYSHMEVDVIYAQNPLSTTIEERTSKITSHGYGDAEINNGNIVTKGKETSQSFILNMWEYPYGWPAAFGMGFSYTTPQDYRITDLSLINYYFGFKFKLKLDEGFNFFATLTFGATHYLSGSYDIKEMNYGVLGEPLYVETNSFDMKPGGHTGIGIGFEIGEIIIEAKYITNTYEMNKKGNIIYNFTDPWTGEEGKTLINYEERIIGRMEIYQISIGLKFDTKPRKGYTPTPYMESNRGKRNHSVNFFTQTEDRD